MEKLGADFVFEPGEPGAGYRRRQSQIAPGSADIQFLGGAYEQTQAVSVHRLYLIYEYCYLTWRICIEKALYYVEMLEHHQSRLA